MILISPENEFLALLSETRRAHKYRIWKNVYFYVPRLFQHHCIVIGSYFQKPAQLNSTTYSTEVINSNCELSGQLKVDSIFLLNCFYRKKLLFGSDQYLCKHIVLQLSGSTSTRHLSQHFNPSNTLDKLLSLFQAKTIDKKSFWHRSHNCLVSSEDKPTTVKVELTWDKARTQKPSIKYLELIRSPGQERPK